MRYDPWEEGWFYIDEDAPEDECGFATDYPSWSRLPDQDFRCERPVWADNDRCVWHAEVNEKPLDALLAGRGDWPERLDGAYLVGINAEDAISFRKCFLVAANLTSSTLDGADLSRAFLSEADLTDTDLSETDLAYADLRVVDLVDANLWEADLTGSDLNGADLTRADLWGVTLVDATLHGADLSEADLSESHLRDISLYEADLRDATLHDADLRDANLHWADLTNATLRDADLTDVDLPNADLTHTNLPQSDLTDANLHGADLTDASLPHCNLDGADMTESILDDLDLQNAHVAGANFEDASLVRADLRGTNFWAARLYQAQLADARINSATEFGEKVIYAHPKFDPDEWDWATDWEWEREPLEAAAWTYRRLESLYEENAMSEVARDYHIEKEEAHRRHHRNERDWWGNRRDWWDWAVYTVNYHLTRHGENPWQVIKVSLYTILGFGLLYPFIGGMEKVNGPAKLFAFDILPQIPINVPEPLATLLANQYFSAVTFTTLGYGDIQPATGAAQLLASVESFVGALLMALLVFVLGRRTTW